MSKWSKFWEKLDSGLAVNIQPRRDGKAKSYQVAQVRAALALYKGDNHDGWLRG